MSESSLDEVLILQREILRRQAALEEKFNQLLDRLVGPAIREAPPTRNTTMELDLSEIAKAMTAEVR